jgi:hypothetical protein
MRLLEPISDGEILNRKMLHEKFSEELYDMSLV